MTKQGSRGRKGISRRACLSRSAAAAATFTIVPRHVLGGPEHTPPSEEIRGALIGCGGQGRTSFGNLGKDVKMVAQCDVRFRDKADDKEFYTDFRRVLERDDIDVVAIATHPGWHALISIAAMESGKDVVCEKPMCRFISEGRAVAAAEKRYGRVFQIERKGDVRTTARKIFANGLLKQCDSVLITRGGFKLAQWSGRTMYPVQPVPANLDWDMYCGPAPLRPFNPNRNGGSHRGYWDYDGGGLGDMATHHIHTPALAYGRDLTHPVEIIPYAPPAHPEAAGMWGWCELKYADGFTWVLASGEWGPEYDRLQPRHTDDAYFLEKLGEEGRRQLKELPELAPLPMFAEAIRTRQPTGSNAERSHHVAAVFHLANCAFRCGRPLKFDPVTEQIVGDEEANRLVNQPMRSPWRL